MRLILKTSGLISLLGGTILLSGCDLFTEPDASLPLVQITHPADGAIIHGSTMIKVEIMNEANVSTLTFRVDHQEVGTVNEVPYVVHWMLDAQSSGRPRGIQAIASTQGGETYISERISVFAVDDSTSFPMGRMAVGMRAAQLIPTL